jgi:DNA-binding response OmpR family regulator
MKILIIEDEQELAKSMVTYLQRENYVCEVAVDFKDGLYKAETMEFDCILLDISLPGGNGLQILKALQADKKLDGVIIISAKGSVEDKITGLNLGADDYVPKPFYLSELSARIGAVIRRKYFQGNNVVTVNELSVDLSAKTVSVHGAVVELTRKESDLLLYLLANKNKIISKNAIAENLSGNNPSLYDNFDFIYAHVKNLKKKLSAAGCSDYIQSIYGMGYKFSV